MAFSYKTPGVYLEEIVKLPPSVASVETAIPCFFGVTQKATETANNDLLKVSKKINSLADYEFFFGLPDVPKAEVLIKLNVPAEAKLSNPYVNNLYYSVKHYFDNGGGPCYIHSVGDYKRTSVDAETYKLELAKLDLLDEVTLIILPDLMGLNNVAQFYDVYNIALDKASRLKDKFVVIDVNVKRTPENKVNTLDSKKDLRDNISNNDAKKYGAAYFPHLETTYSYDFNHAEIKMTFEQEVIDEQEVTGLNKSAKLLNNVSYKTARDMFTVNSVIEFLNDDYFKNISAETYTNKITEINGKANILLGYFDKAGKDIFNANVKKLTDQIKVQADKANADADAAKVTADTTATTAAAAATAAKEAAASATAAEKAAKEAAAATALAAANAATTAAKEAAYNAANTKFNFADTAAKEKENVLKQLQEKTQSLYTLFGAPVAGVDNSTFTSLKDTFLSKINPFFNSIFEARLKEAFLNIPLLLPPSPCIAGVYASVDRSRGVWKAPANVSLNSVKKPEVQLSDSDQEDFNVDAENGKSINCIRQFVGRGKLVWGARTLAGNDKEWKYVNVRRFFNMVEESCENASRHFIFEPNDANTWVRVKGMIDNYLTNLWRDGALQGAKPEHAFYTAVGLNQTMTPDDILNGLLIVEIGLAVVRPAEFIILRFSHKLAVS